MFYPFCNFGTLILSILDLALSGCERVKVLNSILENCVLLTLSIMYIR